MQKFEIVNALIAHRRYRSYLEICTPLTGFRFARVDRSRLKRCHRIMYNSPPEFDDGHEITFRSEDEHVGDLLDPAARYDLIFVDPHHTFECSLRDLNLASHLLEPGGTIVVHDCSPPFRESASASFRRGSWCGLTYCAYIQFVLSHPELDYYTVDSDFGCGIIKKQQVATTVDGKTSTERRKLLQGWKVEEQRGGEMFDYFLAHRGELLNLISVKEFLAREKIELPLTLRIAQELRRLLWVLRCAAKRALALWVIRQIPGQKKLRVPRWCWIHSSRPVARVRPLLTCYGASLAGCCARSIARAPGSPPTGKTYPTPRNSILPLTGFLVRLDQRFAIDPCLPSLHVLQRGG